jgi:hypothetical protein
VLESDDLSVECGDDFLCVHVGNYRKPAESTGLLRCCRSLGIFADLDRWSSKNTVQGAEEKAD